MRKFKMVLTLLLLVAAHVVLAQSTIKGKVSNAEDGTGIPGATVLVKGTNYGVITDISGDYSLKVPEGARTLQFSFVGMKTKDVMKSAKTFFLLRPENSPEI